MDSPHSAPSTQHPQGSVLGAALLISGSCIGAGMLALPILTGFAGFFPSLLTFFLCWIFMTANGLLLIETHGWFPKDTGLVSMVSHSLGRVGRALSWVLYLFLFYSLLVAYVAGSGSLFATFSASILNFSLPDWAGSTLFVLLFGCIVYLGTRPVDMWNRLLMIGKIGCYLGLVLFGVFYIKPDYLLRTHAAYLFFPLPVLVISFGFHNMIPSIHSYLGGDTKRVRKAMWSGSLFALCIYLVWEVVALGIIPLNGNFGIVESFHAGEEASQSIGGILGVSSVSLFSQGLAFFAILTSFLAQSLGLVHFLGDGFGLQSGRREKSSLCLLTLLPPLLLSIFYPQIFFKALNFAGGICAVILFGVFPTLMVWIGRYRKKMDSSYQMPGGKPALIAIFTFSILIFLFQLSEMVGFSFFPKP